MVAVCPPGGISRVTPQWTVRWSSNFMTLFLSTFVMSHWGHFSKKIFENLKNRKKLFRSFWHQRVPPLEKKIWNFFFPIFFLINHTFSIWIWILHVLSFLLMYITYTFIKIFEFSLFYYEFSVDYQLHSSASHSKNSHQKWPFLVPMDC